VVSGSEKLVLERFPVWLNRDSQGRQKGGVSSIDSAL
jgi:hypothetical protein